MVAPTRCTRAPRPAPSETISGRCSSSPSNLSAHAARAASASPSFASYPETREHATCVIGEEVGSRRGQRHPALVENRDHCGGPEFNGHKRNSSARNARNPPETRPIRRPRHGCAKKAFRTGGSISSGSSPDYEISREPAVGLRLPNHRL